MIDFSNKKKGYLEWESVIDHENHEGDHDLPVFYKLEKAFFIHPDASGTLEECRPFKSKTSACVRVCKCDLPILVD